MGGSVALLAVTLTSAFAFGSVIVLLSCLKLPLAQRLRMSEHQGVGLWAALNLILIPMALLGGILVDVWDARWVLLLGSLGMTGGTWGLVSARTRQVALGSFLAVGAGGGFLATATIVLMPRAFFGPEETTASLNLGNVFFAMGALLAPALADVLLRWKGFTHTLLFTGGLAFLPSVLLIFVPESLAPSSVPALGMLLFDPLLWLAGAVFFFYAPLEGCLHTWGNSFLRNMGHDERKATQLMAAFWSTFLLGRLTMAYLGHWRILAERWDPWLLICLCLAATVTLANLTTVLRARAAAYGLLLFGFFLGPIFPTLLALLMRTPDYAEKQGTVFGMVFAIGSMGSLFVSPLLGARFHRRNAQSAIRLPVVLGVMLALLVAFLGLTLYTD